MSRWSKNHKGSRPSMLYVKWKKLHIDEAHVLKNDRAKWTTKTMIERWLLRFYVLHLSLFWYPESISMNHIFLSTLDESSDFERFQLYTPRSICLHGIFYPSSAEPFALPSKFIQSSGISLPTNIYILVHHTSKHFMLWSLVFLALFSREGSSRGSHSQPRPCKICIEPIPHWITREHTIRYKRLTRIFHSE